MRTVYIDVSAKVENWTADSIIALTNGGECALILPARAKQEVRSWLRGRFPGRKGSYHAYVLLAIMVYIIVECELKTIEHIIIDRDYTGGLAEAKIRNELVPLLRRADPTFSGRRILFQEVKGTRADRLARQVFRAKDRARGDY